MFAIPYISKKSRLARLQVGTSTYAVNQCLLRDLNGLGDFLLLLGLRHRDGQNAVLYLGRNLVANHIVRQRVVLLVGRKGKKAREKGDKALSNREKGTVLPDSGARPQ